MGREGNAHDGGVAVTGGVDEDGNVQAQAIDVNGIALPQRGFASILNDVQAILGTTKAHFWPGFEKTGQVVTGFASVDLVPSDEVGAVSLETEFTPILELPTGEVYGYRFSGDNSRHFVAADNADFSFEADDEPFSGFVWALPMEVGSALQALMAKYDEGVATEYSFHVTSGDVLELDLYDGIDGATGDLRYTSVLGTVDKFQMHLYGFTYAGDEGAVTFYKDGVAMDAIAKVETGTYANMDDTAAKFFVGGRDDGGAPDDLFDGWLALPGLAQVEMTAAQHNDIFRLLRSRVGV